MKKIYGKFLQGLSSASKTILGGLLSLFQFVNNLGDRLLAVFAPMIFLFVIGMFIFPPLLIIVFTPLGIVLLFSILFIFSIPLIGRVGVNFFKKYHKIVPEFFTDYSKKYLFENYKNKSFSYYKQKYDEDLYREFEEKRRKEEEERRKRQQQEDERWRRFFEENFGRQSYNPGGYQGSSGSYQTQNPFSNFTKQYEDACDVLGVGHNASFAEIKSAYRKLAKKYHPDLSKERNAEEMFKKINNAFDFLSEENVQRYNSLRR